jgi:hypothetical protein
MDTDKHTSQSQGRALPISPSSSVGRKLAEHLLRADENEHVEVYELRGFISDDLHSAFNELHAVSKGTRVLTPQIRMTASSPKHMSLENK